ncbi:MAG: acyltransferase family protein [Actinomycetota bacterium]
MNSVGLRGRLPTLPALDGIRAVAIAGVLLYHSDIYWFPGGLLGVEVFFVLSGYLITSLLLGELQTLSRIRIKDFLARRARRLLPALVVMLAIMATVLVAWLPHEVARTRGDVAAAATYTSNWYLIHADHSYFIDFQRPSPFGHLWSLAIEEQFYLLWPPILLFLWRRVRRRRRIAGTLLVGAALSSGLLAWLFDAGDPSRIYYGTDTRASGLLIGAALAVLWRPFVEDHLIAKTRRFVDAATVASSGFLIYAFLRFDDLSPFTYRPGLLLVAIATAVLIASCVHPDARVARLYGTRPMRWLGKRSYGVYVWYFPVFALTRPGVDLDVSVGVAFAIRLAIVLTLAALSYRFVEEPIRNGTAGQKLRDLRERARTPTPAGRRVDLAMRASGLVAVTMVGALFVTMANAPAPADGGPSSSIGSVQRGDVGFDDPELVAVPVDKRVVAIGDSVMSGARPQLRDRFGRVRIDARVGRQVKDGIARLKDLQAHGLLSGTVIIHLGNNGHFTAAQFERIMRLLRGAHRVVFVNVKVPRRWETSVNRVIWYGRRRHPEVTIVNWHALWRACRGRVFGGDGTHLTAPGARCYARAIAQAAKL